MARTRHPEPSDKQLELLKFIFEYLQEHCYQPSKMEMAAHFSVTRNAVTERLKGLESRGLLELPTDGAQRAIRLHFVRCRVYAADAS